MVTELILVDQIRVDLDLQMRFAAKPDERHVESLMRAMKDDDGFLNKYPLDLADIDGVLHPVDGHHRLEAAKRLGLPTVSARIVARSKPEAIKAAAGANDHDGVAMKRTVRDRRKAVEQILSNPETRVMVDSEIAKIAGCSIQTVGNIREEKPEWQCDRRVKADGTIVTVSGRPPKRQPATNFQLEVADKGESAMVAKLAAERDRLRAELDRLRGGFKVASGHAKITLEIRPFMPPGELVRVLLEFYGREKVADIAELLAEHIEAEEAKLAAMSV